MSSSVSIRSSGANTSNETTPLLSGQPPAQPENTSNRPSRSIGALFGNLASRASQSDAEDAAPRRAPITVRAPRTFADGSTRPDSVVAQPVESGMTRADGTPLKANSFGLPQFKMEGLAPGVEPHTDSHMHPTDYVQRGLSPRDVINRMNELGLRYSTQMPIPTSLLAINPEAKSGRRVLSVSPELLGKHDLTHTDITHHCGSLNHYYVPNDFKDISINDLRKNPDILAKIVQAGELYVDPSVDNRAAERLRNSDLNEAERSRLDPMMTGLHLGDPRAGEKMLATMFHNKGVFTGVGEITVHKELVQDLFAGRGQAHINNNVEPLLDLLAINGVVGLPTVIHSDAYDLHDQIKHPPKPGASVEPHNSSQIDGFEKLLNDPRTQHSQIIWAHAGGLGRFVGEDAGHIGRLSTMLREHPNLSLDISWSRVASQLTTPQAKERWKAFLKEHSSRIMFGSDTLAPTSNETWNETKTLYDGLFNELEKEQPGIKNLLLNVNYERVIVGARSKVRDFENTVLTPEFHRNALEGTELRHSDGTPMLDANGQPAKRITADLLRREMAMKAQAA